MADPFSAGMKLRASDLNAVAATGVRIAGQVAASSADTLSWTSTEAVGAALSGVAFVSGRTYMVEFTGEANASVADVNMFLKLKYKAGSTVDTSGAVVPGAAIAPNMNHIAGNNNSVVVRGYITAPTTGPYVVVLTGKVTSGTGAIPADNSVPNHWWALTVTCVNA